MSTTATTADEVALDPAEGSISQRIVRFRSDFSTVEALGQVILWILLGVITLGLAFFVFPYYMEKSVLNRVYAVNARNETVGRLHCEVNLGQAIGHALLWALLTITTLGIAGFIYAYKVVAYTLHNTSVQPV